MADILIDLAQRETRTFSNRFARLLMGEMKSTVRMHKHPLKSAGFRVLKAPDVPSVLVAVKPTALTLLAPCNGECCHI